MVILRQERIFIFAGKGKFAECWMIIVYDTTGPSIQLFKDHSAKKSIFEKLHIPSMASQIRFGSTCQPYGNLPIGKPDPKIDSSCLMAFQVERRVKRDTIPQILWLCAESTKQMFAIMKILACGLTIMSFPAPVKNANPNDSNALHNYRPRILQPTNQWEEFWNNPPEAKLISPMELSQNVAKSMDALNFAVTQQQQEVPPPQIETVVKSKSTPELETLVRTRRHSTVSRGSSIASSRSSTSRSLSGRRRSSRSIRVWELTYTPDMPKVPYSPQKTRKYERQESARSSPVVLRQRERQQKKVPEPSFEEEDPIFMKREVIVQPNVYYSLGPQPVKTIPPTPPPLPHPQVLYSPKQKHVYDEVPDNINEEEEIHDDENCQDCHPPPVHHHHLHKHPHKHYSHSVERSSPPSPPQSILKRQPLPKQRTIEDEIRPQSLRPVSGYSSSAYGSGHVTPTHLHRTPPKKEFEVELLRRMSDLSLRPLSRTFTSPQIYEKPITSSPQIYEKPITPPVHKHHKHHHHHIYDVCHSPTNENQQISIEPIEEPQKITNLMEKTPSPKHHHIVYEPCHSPIHSEQPLIAYKPVEEHPQKHHHHIVYEHCHSPVHTKPSIEYEPIEKQPKLQEKPHKHHHIIYEPSHSPVQQPLIEYKPVEEKPMNLLEQSAIPLQKEQRRISDPEYLVKPKVKRRSKPQPVFISQGVQTDHDLPSPPVPLIENFEFAQTKRFTFESHEPHLQHYRKLSQSSRSIYIQRFDDSTDYETVRPFFRTDSSSCASECQYDDYISSQSVTKRHSNPILLNDNQGSRTYTIDVDNSTGLL